MVYFFNTVIHYEFGEYYYKIVIVMTYDCFIGMEYFIRQTYSPFLKYYNELLNWKSFISEYNSYLCGFIPIFLVNNTLLRDGTPG